MSLSKRKIKANNPNIQRKELHFHLYLSQKIKEDNIRIFDVLLDNHARIYKAVYERLNTNLEDVLKEFEEEAKHIITQYTDYGDYIEAVQDYVFERLDEQLLMRYQFELMSLSNLYQVFEQQLRKWIFAEMTHIENQYINQVEFCLENNKREGVYSQFYSNFKKITDLLAELKLTLEFWNGEEFIVHTEIWKTIRECNLLSNTYKHGSGLSAENLYNLYPHYFEKVNKTRLMDLYRTTNLERVLDINKISFEKYCNAMKEFWGKIKEHQYGKVIANIDIST
ncbi:MULTISPECIES: hypothetical protein [Bacillus]|uniref:hypothetical protein n=1 Tax=Bacillus TaxID=1386 RepID=UPI000E72E39B|nr:hypothetical protein [Bacillus safensis]MCY1093202.1 hypothetical protein [Bacillus safensis]RKE70115.1 hypothetical protein DFO75_3006 [Bacillus safensis]GLF88356.1 hypothetical protein R51_34000 [Bacillus safensis]